MKKIISYMFLALVVSVVVVGCNKPAETTPPPAPTNAPAAP
jgi:hypothetical protein